MKVYRKTGFICTLWVLFFTSPAFAAADVAAVAAGSLGSYRYELTITTSSGDRHLMEIYGFTHEIVSPRDAASGLPTGKRQHKPFTVTKMFDGSSWVIKKLLTGKENITSWEMRFWKPSRAGKEINYLTVTLTGPVVSGVVNESPVGKDDRHVEREHVSFTYQKITWAYNTSGVVVEDEWQDDDD